MSKAPQQVRLVLETGASTIGNGEPPITSYNVMGRTTRDILTNKTIVDPSNVVAASQLLIGGIPSPILSGGSTGDVLTRTPTGLQFQPPSAGSGCPFDVVRVPFNAIVLSGAVYYFTFGAPFNVLGTSASTVTVQPATATPAGSEVVCTKLIYSVTMQMGLQYITQAAARRTFGNITADGSPLSSAASTIPSGINNFRQAILNIQYGLQAGTKIAAAIDTNATAPLTLNSGYLDLSVVV